MFRDIVRSNNYRIFSKITNIYVFIFRGSPLFIQFFCAYEIFVLLPKIGIDINLLFTTITIQTSWLTKAWLGALIVLFLNTTAYSSEIFYGALKSIPKHDIEAADAFGATPMQKLKSVQIPLSLPTIFAGVNQTIMMALAMVVIASMIGVRGLGVPILQAISNQYLALGLMNGLAIVALAIIFDRVTQEYGNRIQRHRGQKK